MTAGSALMRLFLTESERSTVIATASTGNSRSSSESKSRCLLRGGAAAGQAEAQEEQRARSACRPGVRGEGRGVSD
jgi:hypothetical protein